MGRFFKEILNDNEDRASPQRNQSQEFQNNEDPCQNDQNRWTSNLLSDQIFYQILRKIGSRVKMTSKWSLCMIYSVFKNGDRRELKTDAFRCHESNGICTKLPVALDVQPKTYLRV
uniref:Uncharacterized protein n=1 Tax=Megaselia scalaris TaxID=36166 RepID=T1GIQ3_MEGSC